MVRFIGGILLLFGGAVSVRHRSSRSLKASTCADIGCFAAYNRSAACQCNRECDRYGNCCSDFDTCSSTSPPTPAPTTPPTPPPSWTTCAVIGCGIAYDPAGVCQCNDKCQQYGNCCSDYDTCVVPTPAPPPGPPPGPAPPPGGIGAEDYWGTTDTTNMSAVTQRLRADHTRLSYSTLWTFYTSAWANLPGLCQGSVYDIYSKKCWNGGQCGTYQKEGDCRNREHSWPKSWWGGGKNDAYSDVFHVMPSDGYVNGRRSSHPFGAVNSPSYSSSEGHKVGSCSSPGYSGTCFEPTDRTKGVVARGHLYVATRYIGQLGGSSFAVSGASMKSWTKDLMLKWHSEHPPQAWEKEWNNRAQSWQGNRNPYIDYPELAQRFFR